MSLAVSVVTTFIIVTNAISKPAFWHTNIYKRLIPTRYKEVGLNKLKCWQLTCQFTTWQSPAWRNSEQRNYESRESDQQTQGWLKTNHPLYEIPCRYLPSESICSQCSPKTGFHGNIFYTLDLGCLHWIACSQKSTPRIKQHVASYHTTEVIPPLKARKWLPWQHPLVARYLQYLHSVSRPLKPLPQPIT